MASIAKASLIAVVLVLAIVGCDTATVGKSRFEESWRDECFPAFETLSVHWSGEGATDCGFNTGEAGWNCARYALEQGDAFRWGAGKTSFGTTTCKLLTQDSTIQIRALYFVADPLGERDESLRNAHAEVASCKSIELGQSWNPEVMLEKSSDCRV